MTIGIKIKLNLSLEKQNKSVLNGLKYIDKNSNVAIHDAVEPLVSKVMIDKLISSPSKNNCVVLE